MKMTPDSVARRVSGLVNTSVDDARSSLVHEYDVDVLQTALIESLSRGHKTRAKYIRARIRYVLRVIEKHD